MVQDVCMCDALGDELARVVGGLQPDKVFVLVDENTARECWPLVCDFPCLRDATLITIGASDGSKTLDSAAQVWTALQQGGASRHSMLVNLGGGMVSDLGGFAAAAFKRGIAFVNIPTTLLGMVDAAVGGKTGVNFGGLKNEVGFFCPARAVLLSADFFPTLDRPNLLSGYAEMLKHGLLDDDAHFHELLAFDWLQPDFTTLLRLANKSIAVKQRFVAADPTEKGIRQALNLGHTIGHALESFALEQGRPVLHGYAVAWGLVCALYLSFAHCGFSQQVLQQVARFVNTHYGRFSLSCKHYPRLIELMRHDKKNRDGQIRFTLLSGIGKVEIGWVLSHQNIEEALDFYREGF